MEYGICCRDGSGLCMFIGAFVIVQWIHARTMPGDGVFGVPPHSEELPAPLPTSDFFNQQSSILNFVLASDL